MSDKEESGTIEAGPRREVTIAGITIDMENDSPVRWRLNGGKIEFDGGGKEITLHGPVTPPSPYWHGLEPTVPFRPMPLPWHKEREPAAETGLTLDTMPADPVPFNEMAALFGSAGTVLGFLFNEGQYRVTVKQLEDRIRQCFPTRDGAFRARVSLIIQQYFENHREDAANWDKDCKEYEENLKAGMIRVKTPNTWRGL